ncbi:hypothetical protein PIROE2DRAFT_3269 [Piromyces sp. E2]|nr:hypothetical protein PIROE2DRAFT_3269 [Piromyces sp. E2]|eukprot:OUM68890.1 hypothetical protein PIROE2DRAFT_3269 [Piromyces sp. E2]
MVEIHNLQFTVKFFKKGKYLDSTYKYVNSIKNWNYRHDDNHVNYMGPKMQIQPKKNCCTFLILLDYKNILYFGTSKPEQYISLSMSNACVLYYKYFDTKEKDIICNIDIKFPTLKIYRFAIDIIPNNWKFKNIPKNITFDKSNWYDFMDYLLAPLTPNENIHRENNINRKDKGKQPYNENNISNKNSSVTSTSSIRSFDPNAT